MPAIDDPQIDRFLDALWLEKGLSDNTRSAYRSDLTSNNFDELSVGAKILDYFWHLALPVTALLLLILCFLLFTLLERLPGRDKS